MKEAIIIAIFLSMDAFSLSIAFGTLSLNKKKKITIALMVGFFHLFMPLIGTKIGFEVVDHFLFDIKYLIFITFFLIGIQMLKSGIEKKEVEFLYTMKALILFSFSVSIDSFSVGLVLPAIIKETYLIYAPIIFSLISSIFTYVGLTFGNFMNKKIGFYATIISGIVFLLFSLYGLLC